MNSNQYNFLNLILLFSHLPLIVSAENVILTPETKTALPEFNLTEYVISNDYPIEIHENIKTEDDYILTLHRIPHGKEHSNGTVKNPVAFLMHGLGGTASNWVDGGPGYALALLLADRGYDVWLGNARGTKHSQNHGTLDPDKDPAQYWDFSWHEIGYYDLYTNINYILNVTQQQRLFYVGHSQGCTAYFVLASTRPEMNDRVNLMVALAPAVYGAKLFLPKDLGYIFFHGIDEFRQSLEIYSDPFGPRSKELICNSPYSLDLICEIYLNMTMKFLGFDPSKSRPEHWAIVQQTVPDSASFKQNLHYIQVALTDEFRQYHLGRDGNVKKYGTELPPFYDLSKISSNVALFYGENDNQATPANVERLAKVLPKVVSKKEVAGYSHVDFLFADSAVEDVYKEIFALMYNYGH